MTDEEKNDLVEQFGGKISRLSHRMILDPELAKEATQEAWFEILKSLNHFNNDSNISTWIYTITKRTILRYAKSERTIKAAEFDEHFNHEPIDYKGTEENKNQWIKEKCDYCLTAFCHCLSNEARLIFLFRDLAELNDSEIASIMEIKVENVRKIASRSKEKVKRFMHKDCILINPNGNCRCRIQKQIQTVDLSTEYKKLKKGVSLVDLFKKFEKDLPRKNYWKKYIQ